MSALHFKYNTTADKAYIKILGTLFYQQLTWKSGTRIPRVSTINMDMVYWIEKLRPCAEALYIVLFENHSQSLSGQPLSGPDIGGFAGNATPRLFARWMGIGALFPFSHGHSEKDTIYHEPWYFGAECEEVCRLALKRHYRLLPHIYTLFYLAHVTGSPVASPMFFAGM